MLARITEHEDSRRVPFSIYFLFFYLRTAPATASAAFLAVQVLTVSVSTPYRITIFFLLIVDDRVIADGLAMKYETFEPKASSYFVMFLPCTFRNANER